MNESRAKGNTNGFAHEEEREDAIRNLCESNEGRLQANREDDESGESQSRGHQDGQRNAKVRQSKSERWVVAVGILSQENVSLGRKDGDAREHSDEAQRRELIENANAILDRSLVISQWRVVTAEDEGIKDSLREAIGEQHRLSPEVREGSIEQQQNRL